MANKEDEMSMDISDDVEEVIETEEPEIEETETETEQESEGTETEEETAEDSAEEEEEPEAEREPEKPNKADKAVKKPKKPKEDDSDIDAELDKFFSDLRRRKEKQKAKEAEKKAEKPVKDEKMFTQAEFEKALKSTLAKKLPPRDEMEQFKKWRESQQTIEEKMSNLTVRNSKLEEELESLRHENLIIKSGVDKEAIDFVQFNVERMDGDFEENLEDYLKSHKKYLTPPPPAPQKTTVVEGADHKKQIKTGITRKELDAMGYQERAKYREEHPEEYAKAMGR
ncbi:MAG: hypothetical protein J6W04_04315 [Bacteroidales bacterium]|nr:hypothetical protein [Bacteroidales bacterium]